MPDRALAKLPDLPDLFRTNPPPPGALVSTR
jgi:hypothetical protein